LTPLLNAALNPIFMRGCAPEAHEVCIESELLRSKLAETVALVRFRYSSNVSRQLSQSAREAPAIRFA
jgi:hypothetical protein